MYAVMDLTAGWLRRECCCCIMDLIMSATLVPLGDMKALTLTLTLTLTPTLLFFITEPGTSTSTSVGKATRFMSSTNSSACASFVDTSGPFCNVALELDMV